MVIGVSGYGYSGSGAVLDFLREFEVCVCPLPDTEFELPYIAHGIQDLEYQLMERKTRYLSSNMAIKEFKRLICAMDSPRNHYRKLTGHRFRERSFAYADGLAQVTWNGRIGPDRYNERFLYRLMLGIRRRGIFAYEAATKKGWHFTKRDANYLSVAPDDFYDSTRQYLRDVLEMLCGGKRDIVVLNQPFDVYDPGRSMKFFDEPKAILVDRDPRDIYLLAKLYLGSRGSFIPTEDVGDYIRYHRLVRNGDLRESRDVMTVRYEDMIYAYEDTTHRIMDFLGLPDQERKQRAFFDPAVSINNTQLYRKHGEYREDIRRIETELSDYLYPFEQYETGPCQSQRPF